MFGVEYAIKIVTYYNNLFKNNVPTIFANVGVITDDNKYFKQITSSFPSFEYKEENHGKL
ncbi:MAG: hypothetical protein QXV17_04935 [Candidatus Micrarchaeaceae archaeon]